MLKRGPSSANWLWMVEEGRYFAVILLLHALSQPNKKLVNIMHPKNIFGTF